VLGAGGAALAAVYGCFSQGASVSIFNRTPEKARSLAAVCGGEVLPLSESEKLSDFEVIINTTSVGMGDAAGQSPVPAHVLQKHHTVFETIYHPFSTQLVKDAERVGATIIRGLEMFLEQGLAQFEHSYRCQGSKKSDGTRSHKRGQLVTSLVLSRILPL